MKMTAKRSFSYRGRALKAGDAFDAKDRTHARQLRTGGMAADAGAPSGRRGRQAKEDRAVATEVPPKTETVNAAPSVQAEPGTYATRVLKAED